MKKLFTVILALVLVLTSAAIATAEDYTIYLITMDLEDMHWVSVDEGAKAAVAESDLSIRYVWSGPTTGKNDAAQIECINNAYADNADVILLASNGPDTEVAVIEQYNNEGVKFIYVDSPANSDVALQTLATNNTNAGELAGKTLLDALTAAGVTEGKIGIANVNAATVSTQQREAGFRKAFEGTNFEILEPVYTDGDAARSQEAATNFITDGVVALFGANEGTTVGVGNAIKAEGEGCAVLAVGFDKSDAILNLVADGYLIATTAQNPYNMGFYGIQSAIEFLKNGTTEFEDMDTGVTMLTAEYIVANNML